MAVRRSAPWSARLIAAGAVVFVLAGLVGFLNAAVVNGANFAGYLNEVRQDAAVRAEVGQAVAAAAIDAQPDLIAVEPAIRAGVSALVGSSILDGVFTSAVGSFHEALTQRGADSAVLALADLGATLTTALDRFLPDVAAALPEDLNVTLAQVGGQGGPAAQIIPLVTLISTLAWVLPLTALLLIGSGLGLAPRRRMALVRLGWLLVIGGGVLGLLVLVMRVAGLLWPDDTLGGAVIGASLDAFSEPLMIRFLATVALGGLLVAASGALLPQLDLATTIRGVLRRASARPERQSWAVVRALAIIGLGTAMILAPTLTVQVLAVVGGLVMFFLGIAELDRVAERARAADEAATSQNASEGVPAGRRRASAAWLVPVGASVAGALVLAIMIVPDHLPQEVSAVTTADPDACNGHVELCDVPFDQVVIPATHNSMSVADGTWYLAEQPKDMVDSLDDGVRGLLVDTWYGQATASGGAITAERSIAAAEAEMTDTYGPEVVSSIRRTIDRVRREKAVGPVEPYFCHTVCEIGATPMQPTMDRLGDWMRAHPREVVVLFIQDTVTPADTADVLARAGLDDLAYTHPDGAWPTLRQMIEDDTRLLVLMENKGGGTDRPWLHQGFDLVADTEYTFNSVEEFDCTLKRGNPDNPLFSVNHWLASFTKLVSNAELVNAYDVLKPRIEQCVQGRGRIPSMIAVNWYDRGDLFRVVDEFNGVVG